VPGPQRCVNVQSRPRHFETPNAELSQLRRRQQAPPNRSATGAPFGGVEDGGTGKGHGWKQGRAPRPAEKPRGSKVAGPSREAKDGVGESLTDGSVVATTRGNARRAKGPYRRHAEQRARQRGMIKPTINLQELRAKLGHRAKSGEIRSDAPLLGIACPRRETRHARSRIPRGEAQ
jgi:hypothetical protein